MVAPAMSIAKTIAAPSPGLPPSIFAHDVIAALCNRIGKSRPVHPEEATNGKDERREQQRPTLENPEEQHDAGPLEAATKVAVERVPHLVAFETGESWNG